MLEGTLSVFLLSFVALSALWFLSCEQRFVFLASFALCLRTVIVVEVFFF